MHSAWISNKERPVRWIFILKACVALAPLFFYALAFLVGLSFALGLVAAGCSLSFVVLVIVGSRQLAENMWKPAFWDYAFAVVAFSWSLVSLCLLVIVIREWATL
ncbi:MAG: hypothetical protein ACREDQ_00395 [Limisphaerales bacterium]